MDHNNSFDLAFSSLSRAWASTSAGHCHWTYTWSHCWHINSSLFLYVRKWGTPYCNGAHINWSWSSKLEPTWSEGLWRNHVPPYVSNGRPVPIPLYTRTPIKTYLLGNAIHISFPGHIGLLVLCTVKHTFMINGLRM